MTVGGPVHFVTAPMSAEDATSMSDWHYDGPWEIYDLHGRVPRLLDAYRSVWADAVDGDLVGFFCVGADARVPGLHAAEGIVDLGWGMNPAWVGKGHGTSFGTAVLAAVRQVHGGAGVRAVVQSWNQPSIRVLRKLGFEQYGTHACVQGGREVRYDVLLA